MSYGLNIRIEDTASSNLAAVHKAFADGRHLPVIARAAANEVKENFRTLGLGRHRAAAPFSFYARARGATSSGVEGGKAYVSIDHEGIALRLFGGTVKPRKGKYLTIPVDDSAVGKRVGEFDDLTWIINRRKGTGVVLQQGRVLYALTKSTTHKADPTVLPTTDKLQEAVTKALDGFTKILEARANG